MQKIVLPVALLLMLVACKSQPVGHDAPAAASAQAPLQHSAAPAKPAAPPVVSGVEPPPSSPPATPPAVAPVPSALSSAALANVKAPKNACQSLCKKTASLKCGALADCVKDCEKPRGVGPCAGVFENFLLCALKEPATHFECMAMPTPGISDPYCGPEQGAMLSCMRSAPR